MCPIHQTKHSLNKYRTFRSQSRGERKDFLFKKGLCVRCCGTAKHLAKDCNVPVRCELCRATDHPSALHVSSKQDLANTSVPLPQKERYSVIEHHGWENNGKATIHNADIQAKCTQVCADPVVTSKSCGKIVMAKVYPQGKSEQALAVYTIIDDQSNPTLGRYSVFDHLRENGPSMEYAMSSCSGTYLDVGRRVSDYIIESMDGSFKTKLPEIIECNSIPDVRKEIPTPELSKHFGHLRDLTRYSTRAQ